ncbi:HNH endonuclease [compost metagenome]
MTLGKPCGSVNTNGYLQMSIENRMYLIAALAVLYMTGAWPIGVVDHWNTVKTDNRWANLRDVTSEVNAQNVRAPRSNNRFGFLGVSPAHGKWAATISLNKKKVHLGLFPTPQLASAAYITAKRQLHVGNTL